MKNTELQLLKTFKSDTIGLDQQYHLGINKQGLFFFVSQKVIKDSWTPITFKKFFEITSIPVDYNTWRIEPYETSINIKTYYLSITDYLRAKICYGISLEHNILLLQSIDLQRISLEDLPPKQN